MKYVWFIAYSLQIVEYYIDSLKIYLQYPIVNLALFVWSFVWTQLHMIWRLFYDKQKKINCKYFLSKLPNLSHTSNGIANNGLIN